MAGIDSKSIWTIPEKDYRIRWYEQNEDLESVM